MLCNLSVYDYKNTNWNRTPTSVFRIQKSIVYIRQDRLTNTGVLLGMSRCGGGLAREEPNSGEDVAYMGRLPDLARHRVGLFVSQSIYR